MTTGTGAHEASEEQRRRERLREEYDSGLDQVPTSRQERRMRELGYDDEEVRAAGYGTAGIMGDLC